MPQLEPKWLACFHWIGIGQVAAMDLEKGSKRSFFP